MPPPGDGIGRGPSRLWVPGRNRRNWPKPAPRQGITFVGPQAEQIRQMGNKMQARALARQCGVPILPGSEKVHSYEEAAAVAGQIGLPVMLKAAAGGGGRGMKIVTEYKDMRQMFTSASAEARAAFGDDTLYLERYIANARHIEVQLLGDRFGNVVHLGRARLLAAAAASKAGGGGAGARHDGGACAKQIRQAAVTLARNIGYENAGTVEFIFDQDTGTFYFLEMNTRIQVEHPVIGGHHRDRPGSGAVPHRPRRSAALLAVRCDIPRPRHRMPHHRGSAGRGVPAESGPDHGVVAAGGAEHPARYPLLCRLHRSDLL